MDATERMIAHDLWLTDQLLARAARLADEALDRTLDLGETTVEEVDDRTLRGLLDHLVFAKETWAAGLTGGAFDSDRDTSVHGMRRRLAAIGPEFQAVVRRIRDQAEWDAAFIDTACDPPETFTYGGAVAHVLTFSAHRRELAIGALRSLGVKDLDSGDPIAWERKGRMA